MHALLKNFALSTALFIAPLASAQTLNTLTCLGNDGSTLTAPVYAYTFDASTSAPPHYSTIYTDVTLLNDLLIDEYFGTGYSTCSFKNNNGTSFGIATIVDVTSAGSIAGIQSANTEVYASVTFAYNFLLIGPTSAKVAFKGKSTPEEQAKALAAFQARGIVVPKQ